MEIGNRFSESFRIVSFASTRTARRGALNVMRHGRQHGLV